jgi:WD40 repeat protein
MNRDGQYFAAVVGGSAVSQLSTVAIFDIAGKRLVSREMDGCSLAFDEAREERLLVAAPGRIQIWNFRANLVESTFAAEGQTGLFVARDGDVLFAGRDASLRDRGYDVSGVRYGHTRAITDVAMSPDGAALATSSEDGSVRLWATSRASLTGHRVLKSLVFWPAQLSATASRVLVAGNTIDVFDLASGNRLISQDRIRSILRRKGEFTCKGPAEVCEKPIFVSGEDSAVAALSSDGLRLAASDKSDDKPGIIVVSDVDSDRMPLELRGHRGAIDALVFTPSGETLLSAARDRTVRVWNARSGEIRRVMEGLPGFISAVAVDPGGNLAVAGFVDGAVRIWDLRTGELLDTLAGHTDAVRSLAFTPDGRHLITASTGETVNVWDIASAPRRRIHRLVHTGPVTAAAVSPDGSRVVTSSIALSERSYDGVARVWDLASGELLLTIRRPDAALTSVAFTRDGRSVVFSSPFDGESLGGAVGVWETRGARGERDRQ